MKKSRLEYAKVILAKVSFDTQLFSKELAKAVKNLLEDERKELLEWVRMNYFSQYQLALQVVS